MDYLFIVIKTVIIYIFVAIIFRVLGKREVGQLGTFDLVVFILIAELVAMSLEENNKFVYNLIPVFVLAILQIIIAKISLKSIKFRKLIDGSPTLIIKNGIINFKNMVEQRYSLDDLLLQLREKDVRSIEEVEYAVLEINGKLSVFKKDDKDKKVYPLPVIVDKEVIYENLYNANKSKQWLLNVLLSKNLKVDDIFYAFCKGNDLYIIKYNETSK